MNLKHVVAIVALAIFAGVATAQSPAPEPKKAAAEKKDAKKAPPKKKKSAAKPAPKTPQKIKGKEQVLGPGTYTTGPAVIRDKDGNVIPTNPDAYNVDSAVKKKK